MSINNIVSNLQLSSQLQVSNGSLDTRLAASAGLSSSASGLIVTSSFVQYASVNFTYLDIRAMYAAPFQVLAAQTGVFFVIDTCALAMNAADLTGSFSNGGDVYLQYSNTAHATNNQCSNSVSAAQIYAMLDNTIITIPGGYPVNTDQSVATFWSSAIGDPVCITNATGAFADGDGSIFTLHIWYRALTFVA